MTDPFPISQWAPWSVLGVRDSSLPLEFVRAVATQAAAQLQAASELELLSGHVPVFAALPYITEPEAADPVSAATQGEGELGLTLQLHAWPEADQDNMWKEDDSDWTSWGAGLLLTNHAASPPEQDAQARAWITQAAQVANQPYTNTLAPLTRWLDAFPESLGERLQLRAVLSDEARRRYQKMRKEACELYDISDDELDNYYDYPRAPCNAFNEWRTLLQAALDAALTQAPPPQNLPWATLACDLYLSWRGPEWAEGQPLNGHGIHRSIHEFWLSCAETACRTVRSDRAHAGKAHLLATLTLTAPDLLPELLAGRLSAELHALGQNKVLHGITGDELQSLGQARAWPRWLRAWYSPALDAHFESQSSHAGVPHD